MVESQLVPIAFLEGERARKNYINIDANPYKDIGTKTQWYDGWLKEDRRYWPVIKLNT